MATPTPSPADVAPPASGLAPAPAAEPSVPPQRDSRMDFLPDGSLGSRLDGSGESLSGAGAASGGYSGIKVDALEGGAPRARGSVSDGAPVGLLVLVALLLGWLLWRFLFASGRVNFAGQDGNR